MQSRRGTMPGTMTTPSHASLFPLLQACHAVLRTAVLPISARSLDRSRSHFYRSPHVRWRLSELVHYGADSPRTLRMATSMTFGMGCARQRLLPTVTFSVRAVGAANCFHT